MGSFDDEMRVDRLRPGLETETLGKGRRVDRYLRECLQEDMATELLGDW
jgi:hypothetical protein